MAKITFEIIQALRDTAAYLRSSEQYQWGHMGACNCGYLCQTVTRIDKAEIHRRALRGHGDWSEQLNDYCPTSGLPFDDIISALLKKGFDIDDLKHLERLCDPAVLAAVPGNRLLRHNHKEDVIIYLNVWADLIEQQMVERILLPGNIFQESVNTP
jgi:hypothetical protein